MYPIKWTVRGVDREAISKLHEVKDISGESLGELLTEAVEFWYDSLPSEEMSDEAPVVDSPPPQVGHNMLHLQNDAASHSLENEK
jgi:hypothetical protein